MTYPCQHRPLAWGQISGQFHAELSLLSSFPMTLTGPLLLHSSFCLSSRLKIFKLTEFSSDGPILMAGSQLRLAQFVGSVVTRVFYFVPLGLSSIFIRLRLHL